MRVGEAEGERAPEQVGGGADVAAVVRAAAGGAEVAGRARGERAGVVVERAELGAVAVGLLEVVAEDLLVLADALAGEPLEPVGEALVQRRRAASSRSRGRRPRGRGCA